MDNLDEFEYTSMLELDGGNKEDNRSSYQTVINNKL